MDECLHFFFVFRKNKPLVQVKVTEQPLDRWSYLQLSAWLVIGLVMIVVV